MFFKKKINLNKYILLNLISLSFCLFIAKDNVEILGMTIAALFTVISQIMLVEAICEATDPSMEKDFKKKRKKLVYLLVFKLFFLVAGLAFGVLFMKKRVIIPLLNYVVQIGALALSLQSLDSER